MSVWRYGRTVKPNLEQGTSLLILQYWCVSKLYLPMAGIKINTQKKFTEQSIL
jgi:hypothetical protein